MSTAARVRVPLLIVLFGALFLVVQIQAHSDSDRGGDGADRLFALFGQRLFETETFGGNGRTCLTCHSRETGTVSPEDAAARFAADPFDPLFLADGSDDGFGGGASRMVADATILVRIPLPSHVRLLQDPAADDVVVRRGIPSTLNTPGLDPVLMLDGRQPDLRTQARSAILGHAEATRQPTRWELRAIEEFQQTRGFFSSPALWRYFTAGHAPSLPRGRTEAEKRGRRFFVDAPIGPGDAKDGLCAQCHSGPMLNETNEFITRAPFARGGRFQSILVSEFNRADNPVFDFAFSNEDGTETIVSSPDPGRALITGDAADPVQSVNAFKIPTLWGVTRTAPYFHDNSARTLEAVLGHYTRFFARVTAPAVDGDPRVVLTAQDRADMIAYLQLLD